MLKPGDVFEKYRVEKLLGRGGMGAVYLVRHNVLDSLFALKILFPDVAAKNKRFVDRFIREAKLACKIKHPNLIAVHDAGKNSDNGMYYLVMDYVSGGSVRDLLKRVGRLSPRQAVVIVRQVVSALEMAWKYDMVHRDIKPDNIMFSADGTAKLADLGIAKSTAEQDTLLTLEASVFGTPAYMSPEQAMDSRKVDCRADIYSLGIVFYEMLSGQRPYRGENTIEILSQVVRTEDVPDIRSINPAIPDDLAELLQAMCAKDIQKRIANPTDLLKRLDGLTVDKDSFSNLAFFGSAEGAAATATMPTLVKVETAQSHRENSGSTLKMVQPPENGLIAVANEKQKLSQTVRMNQNCPPERESRRWFAVKKVFLFSAAAGAAVLILIAIAFKFAHSESFRHNEIASVPPSEAEHAGMSEGKLEVQPSPYPIGTEVPVSEETLPENAIVLLGGATEDMKSLKSELLANEKNGAVFFQEAEPFSQYRKQLADIIAKKPKLVILAPAVRYAELGLTKANFELMILAQANLLRDHGVAFAFLQEKADGSRTVATFNNAIRDLCNLRSFDLVDANTADGRSLLQQIEALLVEKH